MASEAVRIIMRIHSKVKLQTLGAGPNLSHPGPGLAAPRLPAKNQAGTWGNGKALDLLYHNWYTV